MTRSILWFRFVSVGLLVCMFFLCSAFAETPHYRYFRTGSPTDLQTKTQGGFALMGGGKDLDRAFQWMCERSGGGDFLILRASGDDDYNAYVQGLCHVNSVATLVMPDRAAAEDPFAAAAIRNAEAVFIAGGDQANYINCWMGTPPPKGVERGHSEEHPDCRNERWVSRSGRICILGSRRCSRWTGSKLT